MGIRNGSENGRNYGFVDLAVMRPGTPVDNGQIYIWEVKRIGQANAMEADIQLTRYELAGRKLGLSVVRGQNLKFGQEMVMPDPLNTSLELVAQDKSGEPGFPKGYIA